MRRVFLFKSVGAWHNRGSLSWDSVVARDAASFDLCVDPASDAPCTNVAWAAGKNVRVPSMVVSARRIQQRMLHDSHR